MADSGEPRRSPRKQKQKSLDSFFKPKAKKPKPAPAKPAADGAEKPADGKERSLQNKKAAQQTLARNFLKPLQDQGWRDALDGETSKPYLFQLAQFVAKERKSKTVYPPQEHTFAALDACKLDDVKIVIVGQDPYHGPGQAHGLAFSCNDGSIPRSLDNMFKELLADPDSGVSRYPTTGNLGAWARRGTRRRCRFIAKQPSCSLQPRLWRTEETPSIVVLVFKKR